MKELFKLLGIVFIAAIVFYAFVGGGAMLYSVLALILSNIIDNELLAACVMVLPVLAWYVIDKRKKKKDSEMYRGNTKNN